uniref:PH domain-containing protein n=1 Tax=Strigamia maritima TaxID=126957 RepID=T1IH33_STRMM
MRIGNRTWRDHVSPRTTSAPYYERFCWSTGCTEPLPVRLRRPTLVLIRYSGRAMRLGKRDVEGPTRIRTRGYLRQRMPRAIRPNLQVTGDSRLSLQIGEVVHVPLPTGHCPNHALVLLGDSGRETSRHDPGHHSLFKTVSSNHFDQCLLKTPGKLNPNWLWVFFTVVTSIKMDEYAQLVQAIDHDITRIEVHRDLLGQSAVQKTEGGNENLSENRWLTIAYRLLEKKQKDIEDTMRAIAAGTEAPPKISKTADTVRKRSRIELVERKLAKLNEKTLMRYNLNKEKLDLSMRYCENVIFKLLLSDSNGLRTVVQVSDKPGIPKPSSCTEKHLKEFFVNYSDCAPIGMYCETFDMFDTYVNEGKTKKNGNEFMIVANDLIRKAKKAANGDYIGSEVGQYASLVVETLKRLDKWKIEDDTITTASGSTSGIKCDGVIHQRNRKEYLLHLLIKPAFKEGVPEALSYYYRYTCEKIKTAKDPKITNCCHPAIIFFYDGYVLFLYGAVITHQVSVQPLIRPIDLMAVDALIEFSAVLYALDKSLGELDNFYDKEQEQIAHFPIIRYTNLEEYEFKRENMKNIVPAEEYMKIDYEDGEQVVRDCVDAHKLCAERGFAPRVKYHEDNKTYHVVICERFKGERFEGGRFSNEIKTQLRNVLDVLHEGGFVFGDLRPPNILMDEKSRVNLIDFDWSGRDGVDRYPELVNSQIVWPKGMNCGRRLLKSHKPDGVFVIERCKVQMEPKADSPFVFSVGDQDKKTFLSGSTEKHCRTWIQTLESAAPFYS